MQDFLIALKCYLYGIGWLVICVTFCVIGFRVFDRFCPIDFKKEIEEKNMAFAVMLGMFLLGLTFGILYLAANIS